MTAAILLQAWAEASQSSVVFVGARQLGKTATMMACMLATVETFAPDDYPGLLELFNRHNNGSGEGPRQDPPHGIVVDPSKYRVV